MRPKNINGEEMSCVSCMFFNDQTSIFMKYGLQHPGRCEFYTLPKKTHKIVLASDFCEEYRYNDTYNTA